jgi:selenocysteine-specific elongation factor
LLDRSGAVVPIEADRYYAAEAVERAIETLRQRMVPAHEYGPAELREMLGVSRKYLIPVLEHCDRLRVTERRIGGRVISGTPFATVVGDKRS